MPEPVIQISDLAFSYGGTPVLEGVDLTVMRSEFLAVVGPNGGGKTTLVKLMLGLLKPNRGNVNVFGDRPGVNTELVGYVPQLTTLRQDFPITVLDTVRMGLPRKGRSLFGHAARETEAAREALERVNMTGHEAKLFSNLSGGQRQRALIARALAAGAQLLVLDEPTANIDPHGSFCFYDFLCTLGETGVTIVVVSHDLSVLGTKVTSMACVNRTLLYNNKPELTPDMLKMLYGSHDHTCAMDAYMRDLSDTFGEGSHA